ncbi:MAG: RNA 2',3'-cyclic phosphodiesterase [Pseudomonadota bacterium]
MTTSHASRRLFFALWPNQRVRAALVDRQAGLTGRPIEAAKLHLTLAFLGQQSAAVVPGLCALLHAMPAGPLALQFDCYGVFGGARVTWAGMREPPATLMACQQRLALALRQYCAGADARPYLPHVSLTRQGGAAVPAQMAPLRWLARHLVLVESAGGAYRVIASRRL